MKDSPSQPINCWEYVQCAYGPDSLTPCAVTYDEACNGINSGLNGGRSCWEVVGVLSGSEKLAPCAQKVNCLTCDFLHLVKSEEGQSFQLLKLARGVSNPEATALRGPMRSGVSAPRWASDTSLA